MLTLRLMSAAILFNSQSEMLMMKRSLERTLSPGLWAAVGGHLEPFEMGSPRAACLREIAEETGIDEQEITDLQLRYILIRQNQQEIRQQFIYTGKTDQNPRIATEEGELHWIAKTGVFNRQIPFIFRSLLQHYLDHGDCSHVWVGTAGLSAQEEMPTIHWIPMIDPILT